MIYESSYWKDDLLKRAKSLRQRTIQKRWPEASYARVEQTVMFGFYSIRKLIEARKLSDTVANQILQITAFNASGKPVHRINRTHFWEHYDLENGSSVDKDLLFVCHQVVHSYVFSLYWEDENMLGGIVVSSDRERNKVLYLIGIEQIADLFDQIGKDYPSTGTFIYNEKTQDYDVSQGHSASTYQRGEGQEAGDAR